MSDGKVLALALLMGVFTVGFGIFATVMMFRSAERGDTAMTVAWGVVLLGFLLSPTTRGRGNDA